LFLEGMTMPAPAVAGVARWTTLRPSGNGAEWRGPLRASMVELPFADDSFCAILACFMGDADQAVATELARVLAPHGSLLVAGLHPRSLWLRGVAPGHWERVLRNAGLDVRPAVRCGAPWPRLRGAAALPHWLVRGIGGAWMIEARRSVLATLPLRKPTAHRAIEHGTLMPGAHRQCA
jgi:SAM-dependent methyltransferase